MVGVVNSTVANNVATQHALNGVVGVAMGVVNMQMWIMGVDNGCS